MPQLLLYVEGRTEQKFVEEILAPHLAGKGIICHRPYQVANSISGHRTSRGGVRAYAPVKQDLARLLRQWKSPDLRVSTMLDLYGLPADFPGRTTLPHQTTGQEKAQAIADAWRQDVGDPRFLPFILAHEFESLVLSDPDSLLSVYSTATEEVAALKAEIASFATPEDINDSADTAPSKRILKHLAPYQKAQDGTKALAHIGLPGIRRRCPHFNNWLTHLENLQ